MREGYVNADQVDEPRKLLLLVVVDGIAILQDSVHSLDERYEFVKIFSEFLDVGDIEEDVKLGFLWKAAPVRYMGECRTTRIFLDGCLQYISLDILEV